MKKLLFTLAIVGLLALPLLAQEAPKVDFTGSRLAAGYIDPGKGPANFGTFSVPDAKIKATMKMDEDTTAVIRLKLDQGVAGGADYAYLKIENVVNKIGDFKSPVNPIITIGLHKVDFGEETYGNNVVEGALITNSVANISGNDIGINFKQEDLVKNLPFMLAASLSFLNGCGGLDNNNSKAHVEKVSATFKDQPIYVSISNYGTDKEPAGSNSALAVGGATSCPVNWSRKIVELDARYDLDSKKFDPSKAPLFADAKGVFRLTYGQAMDNTNSPTNKIDYTYLAIDGIYNINNKWYVAARISNLDTKWDKSIAGRKDVGTYSRFAIAPGFRMSPKTIIKAEYTINTLPNSIVPKPKAGDNNQVALLFTTMW